MTYTNIVLSNYHLNVKYFQKWIIVLWYKVCKINHTYKLEFLLDTNDAYVTKTFNFQNWITINLRQIFSN